MPISKTLKTLILKEVKLIKEEIDAAKAPGEVPIGSLKRSELINIIKTSLPGNTSADKILDKFPKLKLTIVDLFTDVYNDYIQDIYVVAPKPTMFKIVLKNAQYFFLTYTDKSFVAQISGKKYNLIVLQDQQRALKAISNLLNIGNPPPTMGPPSETPQPSDKEEKPKGKPTGRPPKDKTEEEPEPEV